MNAAGLTRLGYLQRRILARLADSPDGRTTSQMEHLSGAYTRGSRMTAVSEALRGLRDRGLTVTSGKVPPVSKDGRGAHLHVWTVIEDQRDLARREGAR